MIEENVGYAFCDCSNTAYTQSAENPRGIQSRLVKLEIEISVRAELARKAVIDSAASDESYQRTNVWLLNTEISRKFRSLSSKLVCDVVQTAVRTNKKHSSLVWSRRLLRETFPDTLLGVGTSWSLASSGTGAYLSRKSYVAQG